MTFGNTTSGTYATQYLNNCLAGDRNGFTGSVGRANSISAYIEVTTATHLIKFALYDSGRNLVAQTEEKSIPTQAWGWVKFNFTSPPSITNQTYYLIGWSNHPGYGARMGSSYTASAQFGYKSLTYSSIFPGTLTTFGSYSLDSKTSVYCTYTLVDISTQLASDISNTSVTGNGNVINDGGETIIKRGFVYDTSSHNNPIDLAPASSGYASYAEDSGSYGTGSFTKSITGLTPNTTYYIRSYCYGGSSYTYGNETVFVTATSVSWLTV